VSTARLVGPGAEPSHGAHGARRLSSNADAAPVEDQQVRRLRQPVDGQDLDELLVDVVRIVRPGQAQPLRDPEDVGIDGERLAPEGVAQHDVGRLQPNARQCHERLAVVGHLSAVVIDEAPGHPEQRARLGAKESRRADVLLERGRPCPRELSRGGILLEQ
jgi:hypothetical protein